MKNFLLRLSATTIVLLVTSATTLTAQETPSSDQVNYNQVVSVNPFAVILLPWYNGEYERKLSGKTTLGISGSRLPWGEGEGFYSMNAAFRYYPGETPFKGFYLGPRIGTFWVTYDDNHRPADEEGLRLGLGVEVGYAWLLGREEHLSISIGFGATRILGSDSYSIPVLRLANIGWAF
jgi:hypothetical protein